MDENLYPNLATFLIRLVALGMFVYGLGTAVYWLLVIPAMEGNQLGSVLASVSGVIAAAITLGGLWIGGAIALFALSRPLGKLVALGL